MSTNLNKVAIIVATYNAEKTLKKAINSVIKQKYIGQIIIVDDKSNDRTFSIAKEFSNQYSFVECFQMPKNSGPSAARNIALNHVVCEWVAIMDSDDYCDDGRFEKMLQYATEYDIIADDQYREVIGSKDRTKLLSENTAFPFEVDLCQFVESNISKKNQERKELGFIKPLVRNSFIRKHKITYNESVKLGEDYIFICQCLIKGARLAIIEAAGYVALVRPDSLSGSHKKEDLENLYKADYALLSNQELTTTESDILIKHCKSIDIKIKWIEFYKSLKQFNIINALRCSTISRGHFVYIIDNILKEVKLRFF